MNADPSLATVSESTETKRSRATNSDSGQGSDSENSDANQTADGFDLSQHGPNLRDQLKWVCLQIDGGGIRGIIPAQILQNLETLLDKRTCDIFPGGITGTSTGSILAIALSCRKKYVDGHESPGPYSAHEILEFYRRLGPDIFVPWSKENCMDNVCLVKKKAPWYISLSRALACFGCCAFNRNCYGMCGPRYSNKPLKEKLQQLFGEQTLGDALVPIQIVTYDITKKRPIYLNSLSHPDVKMWEAALASSSAPSYFPPVQIRNGQFSCIDGGVVDNSASLAALMFCAQYNASLINNKPRSSDPWDLWQAATLHDSLSQRILDLITLVSLGTGESTNYEAFEKFEHAGGFTWATTIPTMCINGTAQATRMNVMRMQSTFYRIQIQLAEDKAQMDDVRHLDYLVDRAQELWAKELSILETNERILPRWDKDGNPLPMGLADFLKVFLVQQSNVAEIYLTCQHGNQHCACASHDELGHPKDYHAPLLRSVNQDPRAPQRTGSDSPPLRSVTERRIPGE